MTAIQGRKVLVTGAAMGMGKVMARRFAEAGGEVGLVDVDAPALGATVEELRRAGLRAHGFVHDLSRREEVAALRTAVAATLGRIDVLVNNAGVVSGGRYEDIDDARDELMLDVNARAVHRVTKAFLPDLKAAPEAHIVNMASAAGLLGVPYQVIYCASKWFVVGFSEALRQELRLEGAKHVHVTIVCPSLVSTGMFEGSRPPRLTRTLTPEALVARVMDAVARNELYVKEPFLVKAVPFLRTLLPSRVVDFMLDGTGATAIMHGFRGRG